MFKKFVIGCLAMGMAVVVASPADAAFKLKIEDLTGAVVIEIEDGGAFDSNTQAGKITYIGSVGGFDINVTSATSNSPGTDVAGLLSTSISAASNTYSTSALLRITATGTGYVDPGDAGNEMTLQSDSSVSTAGPTTVTVDTWSWAGNSPSTEYDMTYGTPMQTCSSSNMLTASCVGGGPDAFTFFIRDGSDYSLTNRMLIDLSPGGSVNASVVTAAAVPEPGSLLLLGTGLFGVARAARRRMTGGRAAA